MRNSESIAAVGAGSFGPGFLKPCYDGYCFANIPHAASRALTGACTGTALHPSVYGQHAERAAAGDFQRVVLLFVDGFGWRFFEEYLDRFPALQRFESEGMVSKLTSQFPSTTAAQVTSLHTAEVVGAHGVYEWFYYEPEADGIIVPLLQSYAGQSQRGTLLAGGLKIEEFLPQSAHYNQLGASGVRSVCFTPEAYSSSPYNQRVCAGAELQGYSDIGSGLEQLAKRLLAIEDKSYSVFYIDRLDHALHNFGPGSSEVHAVADMIFTNLEQRFFAELDGRLSDTLVLLTADHGHVEVDPGTTIFLNREFENFERYLRCSRRGEPIVLGGSSRDLFLYIEEQHIPEVQGLLSERLRGIAEVYLVADLIADGFFGTSAPSPDFMKRVGSMVVAPYAGETVWWYEAGRFESRFRGSHGGLTPQEVETVLGVLAS